MTIVEKAQKLLELRSQINEMTEAMKPLKAQREELQQNIIAHLNKVGMLSVKTPDATISKAVKKYFDITDEKLVISQLKEKGLTDYVEERINKDLWIGFEREAIKQGMKLEGTELIETEYISIRKTKGGDENE